MITALKCSRCSLRAVKRIFLRFNRNDIISEQFIEKHTYAHVTRACRGSLIHACSLACGVRVGVRHMCFSIRCDKMMLFLLKSTNNSFIVFFLEFDAVYHVWIAIYRHYFDFLQPKQHGSQPVTFGHSVQICPNNCILNHLYKTKTSTYTHVVEN